MLSNLHKRSSPAYKWFEGDVQFDQLFPRSVQALAKRHWTPLYIAKKAARFLAADGKVQILDIGSGIGKFCLAGAHYTPEALYCGVEQRKSLITLAETANEVLQIENVKFVHGNFTQLDFSTYDHFYFYNSFYENLDDTDKIDDNIAYSGELYNYYTRYLYGQLQQKPPGTRLVTFYSLEDEVPRGYHLVASEIYDTLRFWIKI